MILEVSDILLVIFEAYFDIKKKKKDKKNINL